MITAGRLIINALAANGVDRVYCVPGESFLPIFDALYGNTIDTVVAHHESSAGFMALADSRITGRVSAAFVSRGPGATNASIAVHSADQDGVPFLLFIGQVPRKNLRRRSFQEIDYSKMFGDIAKWVVEITDSARIPEIMSRAIQIATAPTPGPVVIVMPEDMLEDMVPETVIPPFQPAASEVNMQAVADAAALLRTAQKPLLIGGGELCTAEGRAALAECAEAWQLPVASSFRRHDIFDGTDRKFVGDLGIQNTPAQMEAIRESDVVFAIGTRLGDLTTQGYTFPESPFPQRKLIHVLADAKRLGVDFRPDVSAGCSAAGFLRALAKAAPQVAPGRDAWIARLRAERLKIAAWNTQTAPDGVVFGNVVMATVQRLAPDALVTLDAGLSAAMFYKHFPVKAPQQLIASITGVMGMGVPGAVSMAMRCPGRQVVCAVGDGSFLMTGNEIALAVERKLPIRFILAANRSYGSIRLNQEKEYPGHVVGTDLTIPEFAQLAQAFGCPGFVIRSDAEIGPMLDAAFAVQGPALVEVKTSLSSILPKT
jgi:acetolactate synthase-1/2/3 large subunit